MSDSIVGIIAQGSSSGSPFGSLLIFVPLFAVVYFVMIRPQRKRQREMAELQSSIGVGDEVTTTSGIYGFITGVEDNLYWLEIDDDVQIRVAKAAIAGRVPDKTDDDTENSKPGDSKPASSKVDKSKADKSKTDKSKTDKSKADKSKTDKSESTSSNTNTSNSDESVESVVDEGGKK